MFPPTRPATIYSLYQSFALYKISNRHTQETVAKLAELSEFPRSLQKLESKRSFENKTIENLTDIQFENSINYTNNSI